MTRPTDRRKRGFHVFEPDVFLGGVDGQPNGQPPPVEPPPTVDLPDRASSETGGVAFGLEDTAGTPDDLNALYGTDSDGGGNRAFTNPTNANDGNNMSNASVGSFAAGSGPNRGYLVADLGSARTVYDLNVYGDYECSTDPTIPISGIAPDNGWSIQYASSSSGPWSDPPYTVTRLGTPGTVSHHAAFALTTPTSARYWRLRYERDVAAGFAFACGTDIHTWEINGPTTLVTDWSRLVPAVNDGDDTTYDTFPTAELIRLDLGGEFAIGRTRVRIETDTAGARELTITGANEADFSDGVVVRTINFTATGSAQDVEDTWSPTDSYRYWQLDIDVDEPTNKVYTWELYEIDEVADALAHVDDPTDAHDASAISYDGTTSGLSADNVQDAIDEHVGETTDAHDASAISYDGTSAGLAATNVQDALDEIDANIAAGPASDTLVWMPLTTVVGGDPELVWDGDDSLIPTLTPL